MMGHLACLALVVGCSAQFVVERAMALDDGGALVAWTREGRKDAYLARVAMSGKQLWSLSLGHSRDLTLRYAAGFGDHVVVGISRTDRPSIVQLRSLVDGDLLWEREVFAQQRITFSSPPLILDDEVVVFDESAHYASFDRTTGMPRSEGSSTPETGVVSRGGRSFVGSFDAITVLQSGRAAITRSAWGGGCFVGDDFVYVERIAKKDFRLVTLAGGDPLQSTSASLDALDMHIAGCFSFDDKVFLAVSDPAGDRLLQLTRLGLRVGEVGLGGARPWRGFPPRDSTFGAKATRFVPVLDHERATLLVVDLRTLRIVHSLELGSHATTTRLGRFWYLLVGTNDVTVLKFDGDTGRIDRSAVVRGVEFNRHSFAGTGLWFWHTRRSKGDLGIVRLDAHDLSATFDAPGIEVTTGDFGSNF